MSTVTFDFDKEDVSEPTKLVRRLNDYVIAANQQFAFVPPRQFVTVNFRTASPLTDTQWPQFQPRGVTPIAVIIARAKNLDDQFQAVVSCPWFDWYLTADGVVKVFSGVGFVVNTRYQVTMEVIGAD